MKKILYTSLALTALIVACNDSLYVDPIDKLTGDNFPITDADAIAAVNGVYQANELSTRFGYTIDLPSDLTVTGENPNGDAGFLSSQQWEPFNSYITYMWETFYAGITNANRLIDKLSEPNNPVTPTLQSRVIGEAKFLRAYYYQYAVQFWGEVPLILHKGVNDEGVAIKREEIDVVYKQIETDLIDAAERLPHVNAYSGSDKGRATWGAAKTLLSKVYLVWGQTSPTLSDAERTELFSKSATIATEVIESGDYALEDDYAQNWSVENRNGKESIFATQHAISQSSDGGGGNHLLHCAFATGFTQALPHVVISNLKFRDEFDPNDQRRGVTYADSLFNPQTGEWFHFDIPRYAKYIDPIDPNGSASNRNIDRTVLRYAEVFLLRAEALNEAHHAPALTATADLNTVRRRAFIRTSDPTAYDVPDGLSYEDFKSRIQQERTFELTYEQNRRLDLVRWRILVKSLKASGVKAKENVSLKNYRFPIPGSQRNINPNGLPQNWGYDGSTISTNPYEGFE
ncbi:MAG: RagB/SusD family nutrient uptake outer membrane protein [Tannerellaceae bacterium]|jgi:hypothetical protein|nr:RagB/SusD family nutrient uptake outer membrane protein [Tannerellaceae bacterium]